jgi:hypothetical protein
MHRKLSIRVEATSGRLEREGDGVEGRGRRGRLEHRGDEEVVESLSPGEQNLFLVGEVAKEGPLRETSAFGDLGDGRLVESLFAVEDEGGLGESSFAVGFPTDH